jgi:hypothetical protein
VPQGNQETHQALNRISPELATQHRRDFGLIDPHEPRRGCLGQLPSADGPVDPNYQSSFDQVFVRVGQAEVGEYVARTGPVFNGFSIWHVCDCAVDRSLTCAARRELLGLAEPRT